MYDKSGIFFNANLRTGRTLTVYEVTVLSVVIRTNCSFSEDEIVVEDCSVAYG